VSAWLAVSLLSDASTRNRWLVTKGVVASVTEANVKDIEIGYRYRVHGQEIGAYERRRKLDTLKPGAAVTVRYDPDRPELSTTRPSLAEWFSASVAIVGTAVTAAFAFFAFRSARARG
jgi:hypothetical protein